jgi:septation ring formation regulator EzrA
MTMKGKKSKKTDKAGTDDPALTVWCSDADKLVQAVRKHLRLIETEHKQARKALKHAKKARKKARKAAAKRQRKEAMVGKRPLDSQGD